MSTIMHVQHHPRHIVRHVLCVVSFLVLSLVSLPGCASRKQPAAPSDTASVSEAYLDQILVSPPPETMKEIYDWRWKADQEAYRKGIRLRGTARGREAERDAEAVDAAHVFAAASDWLSVRVSKEDTPHLYAYLEAGMTQIRKGLRATKIFYARKRPFVLHPEDPTCRKDLRQFSHPERSYPSGHSGAFYGLGLLICAVHPAATEEVMRKAWEKGESRWICGYHWASDVQAAREAAAVAYAKTSRDAVFQSLQRAASKELDGLLRKK